MRSRATSNVRNFLFQKSRPDYLRILIYLAPATFFCWSVVRNGTPAVRHDWLWPLDRAGLLQRFLDLSTGWFSEGFGHPNAYPMTYPVLWPLAPIVLVFGARVSLVALLFVIGFAGVVAAEAIGEHFRLSRVATVALALFLLFNPWTYNKVVAGHLTQMLAYLALALVVVELFEREPRFPRAGFALILTSLQLQFFIFAFALGMTRVRDRAVRRALAVSFVVFTPTLLGVVLDRSWLLSLPFTIPWEDQQSVPLARSIFLGGYFLGYADHAFGGVAYWAMFAVTAVAVAAPFVVRTRLTIALAAFGAAILIFVSGTTWRLADLWRWAIVHGPAIGVFREMYDLIALVAVVYAVLAAAVIGRFRALGWPAFGCALVMSGAWLRYPPADYWVASESLPPAGARLAGATRYAVMPPFQPLSFNGSGAGADPLYAGRAPDLSAANALLPLFPEDRALERYWLQGDTSLLARLGVNVIECRRGFDAAAGGFFHVRSGSYAARSVCHDAEIPVPRAAPIVALEQNFGVCSLCADAGGGNVFFGDQRPDRFRAVALQREFVAPEKGWIDARLTFALDPTLAQAIGGSFTKQARRALLLPPGPRALVNVTGSLRDERGRTLARDTRGYRWIPVPHGTLSVRCYGACLVVGSGSPGTIPLEHVAATTRAVPNRSFVAWFMRVDLPAGSAGILRSLTAYDPGWAAINLHDRALLRHVRIDAAFNGWLVPRRGAVRVWLVHIPSLLQALAGGAGIVCSAIVLALEARRLTRRNLRSLTARRAA